MRLWVGERFGWPGGNLGAAAGELLIPGWSGDGTAGTILQVRMLHVVSAGVVGIALSASGVAMQALLRNPLAEPYVLGLSSGAAAGVMGQWVLTYYLRQEFGSSQAGALVGVVVCAGVVIALGFRKGVLDPLGLLLVGAVIGTINGAVTMLMNYMLGPAGLRENVSRWMMGYIDEMVPGTTVQAAALATVVGVGVLMWFWRAMDVAAFSDAEAVSMGVNLTVLRAVLFAVACVLTAAAVVLAGPVAFVGLIGPHIARLLVGPGHRLLIPGAVMLGAALMILADTATVVLDFGQGRLPVGIFTAVLGGPVFLWLLRPSLGRGEY